VTIGTTFLLILTAYLALIAYGIVGARRRLTGRGLRIAEILLVLVLPVLLAGVLAATGEGELVREWGRFFIAMPVAGAIVAVLADQIARRVDR
jgi:hypothetical protein